MYGDVTYTNPRLLYHKDLINEAITGYAGGDRTQPSAAVLAALHENISERSVSVSGTAAEGNLREVPARDPSIRPEDAHDEYALRVLILVANTFNNHEMTLWKVDHIVRCPCCFHMIPAGLTQCFVCSTNFNLRGAEFTSMVAAAVPMDNLLSTTAARRMARAHVYGNKANCIRSMVSHW